MVRPNPRFDHRNKEIEDAIEEDLPMGMIHMIGGSHYPDLANKIQGKIRIIRQMHEVFSVQPTTKKPRQYQPEPGIITFTKAHLEQVQYPLIEIL